VDPWSEVHGLDLCVRKSIPRLFQFENNSFIPKIHGAPILLQKSPVVYFNYFLLPAILQKTPLIFSKIIFCPDNFMFRSLCKIYNDNLVPALINLVYFNYPF
jgi:hypothetical protein